MKQILPSDYTEIFRKSPAVFDRIKVLEGYNARLYADQGQSLRHLPSKHRREQAQYRVFRSVGWMQIRQFEGRIVNHRLQEIKERLYLRQQIRDLTVMVDGQPRIHVIEWGRDCDHCESSRLHTLPPSLQAFEQAQESMYDNAEGPCSLHIVSAEEAAEFSPYFRDHILEAFEDGHPYSVAR